MKKYVNRSNGQAAVELEDGTVQYIRRGQTFVTAEKVVNIRGDVEVIDVGSEKATTKVKKTQ